MRKIIICTILTVLLSLSPLFAGGQQEDNKEKTNVSEAERDKTLIVIAHRLSTIKSADQILVLEEGSVSERGNHGELLENNGTYADYWHRRQKVRSWTLGAGRPVGATAGRV